MDKTENIEKYFSEYLLKMMSIEISVRSLHSMFNVESKRLFDLNATKLKNSDNSSFSVKNFILKTLDGEFISYDFRKYNYEESKANLLDVWNKHYQILLVQAFEAFLEFIQNLYDDLYAQGLALPKLSHKSERTVTNIRKELFKIMPSLEFYDTNNQLKTRLKFTLPFIEKLRHLIAHSHGEFKNFEKFKSEVLNVNNLSQKDDYIKVAESYFESFTRKNEAKIEVWLIPMPHQMNGGEIIEWLERFDVLNDDLMAYAELLQRIFIQKIKNNQHQTKVNNQ